MALLLFLIAFVISYTTNDANHVNRFGGFIIGVGVWMSMRGTFREGVSRYHNVNDEKPVINGKQLNMTYLHNAAFRQGDAVLQVYGFIIVIAGSICSAYGDIIYNFFTAVLSETMAYLSILDAKGE